MKKFLSLVLAMIMTMSLVTISAGATEYRDLTDKDEIQYEEAVAVLNRLGIITGYDDGSFRPEDELTRGAAAKIIVSLLIGPDAASSITTPTAPFPDVPTSHTFAGVISYCNTAGIISGYGDGTFKPGNSLTGFAFAKMLLGALGYKAEIEGFVDTGWTQNVARVGSVVELFNRLEFDGSASVNREQACQLALNTLKATEVEYPTTAVATGTQVQFVEGTRAVYKTSNNRDINANINRRVINATNNEMTLEFGEEHFKDLRLEHDKYDPAYDVYGHPSNEWSYKKVTIGTFPLEPDFVFTSQVAHREDSAATKEKALGLRGYDTYSTDHKGGYVNWSTASSNVYGTSPFDDATQITINGWDARVLNSDYKQTAAPSSTKTGNLFSYDAGDITSTNKELAPSLSEIADLTDNGVTVEVYVCPVDADFITNVVVTRTQLMEVDRVGSDYVSLDKIEPDSRDPRKAGDLAAITGYNDFAIDVDVQDVKDDNYDAYNTLSGLKAGDLVAVIPYTEDDGVTYEVGEAYVPETVSGAFTKVTIYNNTNKPEGSSIGITIGGNNYVINEWNKDMLDVTGNEINATKQDVTLYLAKDGTALWADEIGNSDDWMIVGDYYQAANSTGKVVWYAHGWTIGGDEVNIDLGTIRGEAEKYAPGELVHYDIAETGTGEYQLSKPNITGKSRLYGTGDPSSWDEPILRKTINDVPNQPSGEGVYNVAQFALNSTITGNLYAISSVNSLIPLENYNVTPSKTLQGPVAGGAIFLDEADPAITDANGNVVKKPHDWYYLTAPYSGVKFVFVNFDAATGEVDSIYFKDGVQNVSHEDLTAQNTAWVNVGTNVVNHNWVVSPAEAYVDKDGNVKTVVVKTDSTEADLSSTIIIKSVDGENVSTKGGADTPPTGTYYTRQYVQGPNFDEVKTGYFDAAYRVGDILTVRSVKNNLIECKYFNSYTYANRNPDAFEAIGVQPLMTQLNEKSKDAFYVGKARNASVDSVTSLKGASLTSANADIMTNKHVMGDDINLASGDYVGLIKVFGAKWIDLRANHHEDIQSLSDLLDYDNASVRIRVLVDGKESTDAFRRAYAVVVLSATEKGANDVVVGSGSLMPVTDNFAGFDFAYRNGIRYNTLPGLQKDLKVGDKVEIHVKPGFSIEVDPAGGPVLNSDGSVSLAIPGDSSVPVTISKISDTTEPGTVQVIITGNTDNIPVYFNTEGETEKSGSSSVSLTEGKTYSVSISQEHLDAGYSLSTNSILAAQGASLSVSKSDVPQPGDEVNISISGTPGETVIFTNAQNSADTLEVTIGEDGSASAPLASGKIMNVSATNPELYAKASSIAQNLPYGKNFIVSSDVKVEVYKAGEIKFTPALTYDGQVGAAMIPDVDTSARAESLDGVEYRSSVQNVAPYYKTSVGDVYILWESGEGLNEGMLLMHKDTLTDVGQTNIQLIFDAMTKDPDSVKVDTKIDQTIFDAGYSGEQPPAPVTSDTIRAKLNGSNVWELYLYYGGNSEETEARPLTEAEVKGAIATASKKVVETVNLTTGAGTFEGGEPFSFSTSTQTTPNQLFEVTILGNTSYMYSGETFKVSNKIAGLLNSGDKVSAAADKGGSVLPITTGNGTLPDPLEEEVTYNYVEALQLKTANADGGTQKLADVSGGAPAVTIWYNDSKGNEIAFDQGSSTPTTWIEKGLALTFQGIGNPGENIILTINDEDPITLTCGEKGTENEGRAVSSPISVSTVKKGGTDVQITKSTGYKVFYNDQLQGVFNVGDFVPLGARSSDWHLCYEKSDETLATVSSGPSATPTQGNVWTLNVANNSGIALTGGIVKLYDTVAATAQTVTFGSDPNKIKPLFYSDEACEAGDAVADDSEVKLNSELFIVPGTTAGTHSKNVFIQMNPDDTTSPALTVHKTGSFWRENIYSITVTGPIAATAYQIGLVLPADPATAVTVDLGGNYTATETETVEVSGFGNLDDLSSSAKVSAAWFDNGSDERQVSYEEGGDTKTATVTIKSATVSNDGTKVTVGFASSVKLPKDTELGTVRITIVDGGKEYTADFGTVTVAEKS